MATKDVVGSMQYAPEVQRKSLEDPMRYHRRISIPFADRRPSVKFIRKIDQRKASVAGPHDPRGGSGGKPILKKGSGNFTDATAPTAGHPSTNDELDAARFKVELIMDRISKSERVARGSMDILTFPTPIQRIEALARYQGCMTIGVCIIDFHFTAGPPSAKDHVADIAQEMHLEAVVLQGTAKRFLTQVKLRNSEWSNLLKKHAEFRVLQTKLSYPIYTHKKMPESVTLFEDSLEEDSSYDLEGCVRICRSHPGGAISLHCDCANIDKCDVVDFQGSSPDKQMEIIRVVTTHAKDLLFYSNSYLQHGLETLQDHEIDDDFAAVQKKINGLKYDSMFDPLCSLELKNALGELMSRKAELLNTAEKITDCCKWVVSFTKAFSRYARNISKNGGKRGGGCCGGPTKKKLLSMIGIIGAEDSQIYLPLSFDIARDIFHVTSVKQAETEESKAGIQEDEFNYRETFRI